MNEIDDIHEYDIKINQNIANIIVKSSLIFNNPQKQLKISPAIGTKIVI